MTELEKKKLFLNTSGNISDVLISGINKINKINKNKKTLFLKTGGNISELLINGINNVEYIKKKPFIKFSGEISEILIGSYNKSVEIYKEISNFYGDDINGNTESVSNGNTTSVSNNADDINYTETFDSNSNNDTENTDNNISVNKVVGMLSINLECSLALSSQELIENFKDAFSMDIGESLNINDDFVDVLALECNNDRVHVFFNIKLENAEDLIKRLKQNILNNNSSSPKFLYSRWVVSYSQPFVINNIRMLVITQQEYWEELQEAISIPYINILNVFTKIKDRINFCCSEEKINNNSIVCDGSSVYTTIYNQTPRDRSNCCNGYPKFSNKAEELNWFKNQEPRIQNGRWNHSFSNTKMFPIISRGFEYGSLNETSKNLEYRKYKYTRPISQSKNLFKNTSYKMSRNELISYLSKNRVKR